MRIGEICICIVIAAIVVMPVGALAAPSGGKSAAKDWTLLMYWDADNNLEFCTEFAMLTWEESLPSDADVNIVVMIDLLSAEGAWIYDIVDGKRRLVATWEEKNTSDPAVLKEFVMFGLEKYPSEKTMLVVQDHGYGWRGACNDETNGDTLMSVDGLAKALNEAKTKKGRGVDLLAFDACNMMTLEVAYELRDAVPYLVGSETMVPFDGLPYALFIPRLVASPEVGPRDLAAQIVSDYVEFYSSKRWEYEHIMPYCQDFATASAFDMSLMARVGEAFAEVTFVLQSVVAEKRSEVAEVRGGALLPQWANMAGYEWMPDVLTFVSGLRAVGDPALTEAVEEFEAAFEAALIAEAHSDKYKDRPNGLNFWFPPSLNGYESRSWWWAQQFVYHESALDIVEDTAWVSVLMSYYGESVH